MHKVSDQPNKPGGDRDAQGDARPVEDRQPARNQGDATPDDDPPGSNGKPDVPPPPDRAP